MESSPNSCLSRQNFSAKSPAYISQEIFAQQHQPSCSLASKTESFMLHSEVYLEWFLSITKATVDLKRHESHTLASSPEADLIQALHTKLGISLRAPEGQLIKPST